MRQQFEEFYEVTPGAQEIVRALRSGAAIRLCILPDTVLSFRKEKKGLSITETAADGTGDYDMDITVPRAMIEDFFAVSPRTAEGIITFFANNYYNEKYRDNVSVTIHAGAIRLALRGYLGLIPLGGSALMNIFRSKGIGTIEAIAAALKNITRR